MRVPGWVLGGVVASGLGGGVRWTLRGGAAWVVGGVVASACGGSHDEATGSVSLPLEQCPVAGVEGIDVSDDQGSIDWSAVADAGVGFAMIKATQGTYDTQATFARNWAQARSTGIARGAYHFFDPTEDGVAQAQHFLAVMGPLAAGDLSPMLDIECPDGDPDCLYAGAPGSASAVDIATRMWGFLGSVARATHRTPIVYTFGSYFEANGIDTTGLEAFPLFLAFPMTGGCLDVPLPWTAATLWQYSWAGEVDGIEGAVDRDRWLVPFSALTGNTQSTPVASTSTSTPTFRSSSSCCEPGDDAETARSSSCSFAAPRSRPGPLVAIACLAAVVLCSRRLKVREPRLLPGGRAC